jgi:hypothetical protein
MMSSAGKVLAGNAGNLHPNGPAAFAANPGFFAPLLDARSQY